MPKSYRTAVGYARPSLFAATDAPIASAHDEWECVADARIKSAHDEWECVADAPITSAHDVFSGSEAAS